MSGQGYVGADFLLTQIWKSLIRIAVSNAAPPIRQKVNILSKKDLEFSYFCGSGAGGQARNKVHSGCQIFHAESGATARASDSRSLDQNKHSAFKRLLQTPKMKFWLAKKIYEVRQEETIEESVARDLQENNLKVEIRKDGKWTEVNPGYFDSDVARLEPV